VTLEYIDNPVLSIRKIGTKEKVMEIMEFGLLDQWVIICSSETNTKADRKKMSVRTCNFRISYEEYTQIEWALHIGENNYSIIARKVRAK
jgi:hypothetical protein